MEYFQYCVCTIETPRVREWPTFIFSTQWVMWSPPSSHWSLLPLPPSYLCVSPPIFLVSHNHILTPPPFLHFRVRRNRITVTLEDDRNKDHKRGKGEDKSLYCLGKTNRGMMRKHAHIKKPSLYRYATEADWLIPQQQLQSLLPWHLHIT